MEVCELVHFLYYCDAHQFCTMTMNRLICFSFFEFRSDIWRAVHDDDVCTTAILVFMILESILFLNSFFFFCGPVSLSHHIL